MACPDLLFTSGVNVWGLGTWDGGTKVSLRFSSGFVATYSYPDFTFLYSTHLPSTITNYAGTVINMAVTDDGYAFVYVRLSGQGHMGLYRHDIAAGTSTVWDSNVTDNNRLVGPSYNPFDGNIYELWNDSATYRLLRWDAGAAGEPEELTTLAGSSSGHSDMLAFTSDGGCWFDFTDPGAPEGHPRRLELDDLSLTTFSGLSARITVPVPNSASSVLVSTADDQGWELHSNGSAVDTDCTLFDSDGTARVHCGVDGVVTFLYPTFGGVGTAVYGLVLPAAAGQWTVGRVRWPQT